MVKSKSTTPTRAIIFDLDGTLLDTLADIGDSVNQMLLEYGFSEHTLDDYRRFIGNGLKMLVMRALPIAGRSEEMVRVCVQRAPRDLLGPLEPQDKAVPWHPGTARRP